MCAAYDRKDVAEVFKLLQLHETEGKLFDSRLFSKWVAFVELRSQDSPEAATKAMISVLAGYHKGDDLAMVLLFLRKLTSKVR